MSDYEDRLRIVAQFNPDEHEAIRRTMFGKLERRLSRWEPEQVEMELSVKERGENSQRMVLESWIADLPKMVATSTEPDLNKAVVEVRDDLMRQINRFIEKREGARKR